MEDDREVIRQAIATQMCPWCGRGPWVRLPRHTSAVHGVTADDLRRLADLPLNRPVCSAENSEAMSAIATSRDHARLRDIGVAARERRGEVMSDPDNAARAARMLSVASFACQPREARTCSVCQCLFSMWPRDPSRRGGSHRRTCSEECEHELRSSNGQLRGAMPTDRSASTGRYVRSSSGEQSPPPSPPRPSSG